MSDFRYTAVNPDNKTTRGIISAKNGKDAKQTIDAICTRNRLRLLEIEKKSTYLYYVQKKNEKLLSADVDRKIVDNFLSQASKRGFTKKRVLAAAVELWTKLPLEIQARLLDQSLDSGSFTDLVRQIADEQIQKALKKKSAK